MRLFVIGGMALRDYLHERTLSACGVLALAAMLAPLLILFGVRNGVIGNLQERLIRDPRNLEIVPVGSGKYGGAFFEELRQRADVGYAVPQTRSIAATIGLLPAAGGQGGLSPKAVNVSLIPSGEGDPLTQRFADNAVLEEGEIILTASAAEKLGVQAGDALTGRITRARGLLREEVELPLRVKAVLPLSALQKDAAFAPLSLLEDAETYRDGMAVPARGWPGAARPEAERLYPSFRLYARDMDGVATLRDFFAARGIETAVIAKKTGEMLQEYKENVASGDKKIVENCEVPDKGEGAGFVNAPRGGLSHWLIIENKKVANFQLVVPSTWNLGPRCSKGIPSAVEEALVNTPIADPKRPVEILRTVHSFDPCIACAVHVIDGRTNEVSKFQIL